VLHPYCLRAFEQSSPRAVLCVQPAHAAASNLEVLSLVATGVASCACVTRLVITMCG
jgi:hypothetical protein